MKMQIEAIFKKHPGHKILDDTNNLMDSASVDDIINKVNTSEDLKLDDNEKTMVREFLKTFYDKYYKEYFEVNERVFKKYADNLNKKLSKKNVDIFGYVEKISGVEFVGEYRPVFYYTLRPIGAQGFLYNNEKISTIQRNITSIGGLLNTPFHEYSHEIFMKFTRQDEFMLLCDKLKNNDEFMDNYKNGNDSLYNWVGWCEENLVEGFAKYLSFNYYGLVENEATYTYDLDFYNYLKDIKFNPEKITLKEASIEFYKSKVK